MSVALNYRVEDAVAGKRLQRLLRGVGDLYPMLDEIGASLVTSTQMRFEREQAPDGQRWRPSIRAQTTGGKTLTDTRRLADSITHVVADGSVEVGTNVIYAGILHSGGTINAKGGGMLKFRVGGRFVQKRQVTIPARPIVGVGDDDRAEISAIVSDYLAEAAR